MNPGLCDHAKAEKPAAGLGGEVRPSQVCRVLGCECYQRGGLLAGGLHFHRWRLTRGCKAPRLHGNQGPESQWMMVTSSRTMASFQCAPSLSTTNPTHVTPILLHQEKRSVSPKTPRPPRTQHESAYASRGGCCLHLQPPPTSIMKKPRRPWVTASVKGAIRWTGVRASLF